MVGELGPFPLAGDDRWRWKAWGRVVEGQLWVSRFEMRFRALPCGHVERPDGLPEWEPTDCDCWDDLDAVPPADALPVGGLTSRMLRGVRLGEAAEQWHRIATGRDPADDQAAAADRELVAAAVRERAERIDTPGNRALLAAMVDAEGVDNGHLHVVEGRRGRPPLPDREHLRRLRVMFAAYDKGRGQDAAVRRLGITTAALRASVAWAQERGYVTRAKQGQRRQLTEVGRAALAAAAKGTK